MLSSRATWLTGTMRRRAVRSSRPAGVAGALATVHSLGASSAVNKKWLHIPLGVYLASPCRI
jgi:hypothetical protein